MHYEYEMFTWHLLSSLLSLSTLAGITLVNRAFCDQRSTVHFTALTSILFALGIVYWWTIGFSLTRDASLFIGNFRYAFLRKIQGTSASLTEPELPMAVVAFTSSLQFGVLNAIFAATFIGRSKLAPTLLFVLFWNFIVLTPVWYWCFSPVSWAGRMGVIDFIAGGPNICIGFSSLAVMLQLHPRAVKSSSFSPNQVLSIYIGVILIWIGWLSVAGTATYIPKFNALLTYLNVSSAGIGGGLGLLALHAATGQKTAISFPIGAISGFLVAGPMLPYREWASIFAVAFVGSIITWYSKWFGIKCKIDDPAYNISYHGISGVYGMVVAGILASKFFAELDSEKKMVGSWVDNNWLQPLRQLGLVAVIIVWSILATYAIFFLFNLVFKMSYTQEEQEKGIDCLFLDQSNEVIELDSKIV